MHGRRGVSLVAIAVACLALPPLATAAFPGNDPGESPRLNTPNDPKFDQCELDDEDTPQLECDSYWNEDFRLFGFSPDSANTAPVPLQLHSTAATSYGDCSQLDQQGRDANVAAGDPECAQIAGIRADTAWKYTTGDPDVAVAILDTGIRWQNTELVNKVRLNADELPLPQGAGGAACADYDCNGDGAFNIRDYADDSRVSVAAGDTESDSMLDGSDLIGTFSDGTDADGNGYVDDIAGWDFFDDDNDPFDASSCCSANGHGSGRASEAVASAGNGSDSPGICPKCQFIPLRVWDTFVVPIDNYAMATLYATNNGASVVEGAVGALGNSQFARRAFQYADDHGVALTLVSSDINSANHNYPTNYNESIYIAGSLPDTAPYGTCDGGLDLPGVGNPTSAITDQFPDEFPDPQEQFTEGCNELMDLLSDNLDITPTAQPITTSFFRNSNLTQYGGKADVVLVGDTGSVNTGQASGAAGLIASYGRERFGDDDPLSGNEIRQLMTMTAEDVLSDNTGTIGLADKANAGWDPHFGYGRLNLAGAMARIANDHVNGTPPCAASESNCVPPEAQIDSPDWFAPIDVDRVPDTGIPVRAHAAAPHSDAGVGKWELEYACGQDALDSEFLPVPGAKGTGPADGVIGTLPKDLLENLAATCDGQVADDPGRPAGGATDGVWPADPYPDPDPERHAFQIRFTVHEADDEANFGRYRKTLFAYADDGNLDGWPRPVGTGSDAANLVTGSGGEAPERLYDLNGDNALDVIQPTTSGELYVLNSDGTPLSSWNGGEPVRTGRTALATNHGTSGIPAPREPLRAPAIGDLDGDLSPDVVDTAGERVYAWDRHGEPLDGFPVRIDPALSDPCVPGAPHPCLDAADRAITSDNHIKRGIFGSPALADLDGDGGLDIVTGSLDAHVYAWDGDGDPLPNFPVQLDSDDADGAEIVNSPAIAQLDGEGPPEIVIATNEVVGGNPEFPTSLFGIINAALSSSTGSNPVYALHGDGSKVDGWPVGVGVAAGDLLPLVLPGHDAAVLDTDGDGTDEVSLTAGTGIGGLVVDGTGAEQAAYQNAVANSPDQGPVLNLADYPAIGDLAGDGTPLVIKGGLTVNGAANLLATNQNLPFSHVVQAWDPSTGLAQPGFPRATDDFQLVSMPSIGRVSGSGPERQAIYGTGLYQLHAYGPDGLDAEGWPKFTGGWIYASPSIGDTDGDGDLDVTTLTREGWSFMWDTGVDACDDSNSEWWTYHHDEHGTANYSTDARPPGTATDLAAERDGDAVTLSWYAPGDDWLCGTADRYRVLASHGPIDSPADGDLVAAGSAASPAGVIEFADLEAGDLKSATHAGVLYRDDAGNWGLVADVALPRKNGEGDGGGETGGGDGPGQSGGDTGAPAGDTGPGDSGAADDGSAGDSGSADGGSADGGGASAACSNAIDGSAGDDKLSGTDGPDVIRGLDGADRINARGGDDCVSGQGGEDLLSGGSGDDVIRAAGGGRDRVDCGPGEDIAFINRSRDRARNCEKVRSK
jgi:hypothetical protein